MRSSVVEAQKMPPFRSTKDFIIIIEIWLVRKVRLVQVNVGNLMIIIITIRSTLEDPERSIAMVAILPIRFLPTLLPTFAKSQYDW